MPEQSKPIVKEDRKPTESEIKRVHELFSGNWDILGITEDGNELGPELIRQRFAQGGRVQFGARGIAIVNPKSEERRITTYRVDPSKSPSQIDVTTQFDSILKGIYKFEGDRLTVCLARHEDGARPTEFEARGGSDRALFQLQLSRPDPKPRPAPAAPARPAPAEESPVPAESARRMLIGSWTTTDLKGTFTIVFRPDGTFSATRIWSKSWKKLLGPASDTSEGDWRLARWHADRVRFEHDRHGPGRYPDQPPRPRDRRDFHGRLRSIRHGADLGQTPLSGVTCGRTRSEFPSSVRTNRPARAPHAARRPATMFSGRRERTP